MRVIQYKNKMAYLIRKMSSAGAGSAYQQKKEEFLTLFRNDPDLSRLPLPDSIREKLNLWMSADYIPPTEAVKKCLFSGARYDGYEERKPDESVTFPNLMEIATIQSKVEMTDIAGNVVD